MDSCTVERFHLPSFIYVYDGRIKKIFRPKNYFIFILLKLDLRYTSYTMRIDYKLYKLVDCQYVDADRTFLGRCAAGTNGAAGVPVRGLYEPVFVTLFILCSFTTLA